MNEGYSQILSKKSEFEAHFKEFTKNFQKQLAFIELKVRQDAAKLSKIATCCLVLCGNIKDRSQLISVEQKKLNKPFFLIFQLMTIRQRQFYLLELLDMIGSLVEAYHYKLDTTKKDLDHIYLKQLREQLADGLQDIYVDNTISLKQPSLSKQAFYVRTICDSVATDKNLKVDRYLLLLIEHIDKRQIIEHIDVRNYLLLNEDEEQQVSFTLRSIFDGVAPYTVKILFLEEEEKRILESYLIEIVKIGKIQRLVNNLDMERHILRNNMGQTAEKKDIFSSQMMSINNDPEITFDADNIKSSFSPRYVKRSVRRQETQIQYFNELKRTIVRALNELAIKKTAQNQRIKKFKNQALSGSKRRSQQLIDAANNQQARIVRVRQKNSLENEGEEVVNETILRIAGFKSHVIVSPNKINRGDTFRSEDEDSYLDDDRTKQLKKNTPVSYSPNIYSAMYPGHRMSLLIGLSEYHEIELNRKIWINPQSSEIKTTRQQLQRELLIENVRVYGHKKNSNKFKVIIKIVADLKGLIMTLANLEAWPLWHPNITKIDLLNRNHSENSIEILLSCNKNNVSFEISLKVHLFKVDNRYFIVMKSLQNRKKESKRSSLLSFLGFGSTTDLIYDYLLLTIQTYGSKGNSVQIIADFQLNPSALKKKSQIKLEQMTFLINFYFITSYWKIDWNQHNCNEDRFDRLPSNSSSCLFDLNWKVESTQFVEVHQMPDSGKMLW